jgi:hypothetical protein
VERGHPERRDADATSVGAAPPITRAATRLNRRHASE